jgi:hypothetical protein
MTQQLDEFKKDVMSLTLDQIGTIMRLFKFEEDTIKKFKGTYNCFIYCFIYKFSEMQ